MSIACRSEYFVSVDRDVSLNPVALAACPCRAVFPKQVSRRGVQRLDDPVRVRQVHGPVVDKRRSLLSACVIHRPRPSELKSLYVPRVDLIERAVPPRVVGTPPVEPIARSGIAQHGLGDRVEIFNLRLEPQARPQNADPNRKKESA